MHMYALASGNINQHFTLSKWTLKITINANLANYPAAATQNKKKARTFFPTSVLDVNDNYLI